MKRDKFDAVVSDIVRNRADWTCECCGIVSEDGRAKKKDRAVHGSHFTSRGAGNIARYDTDAIACHCGKCHAYLGERPYEHSAWFVKTYGEGLLEIIKEKHSRTHKMTKGDKADMYSHYKSELARVLKLRKEGVTGYIETVSWF